MDTGAILGYIKLNILAYPKDMVIISRTKEGLGNLCKVFNNKITELRLSNNVSKC